MKIFKHKPKKVTLALGSGGARGLAHIGVLKVLEEKEIEVCGICGTSVGALIGAFYALGYSADELEKLALKIDLKQVAKILTPTIPYSGFIDGDRFCDFIASIIGQPKISQMKIPFAAVATNIMTGKEIVINDGSVVSAIRASISIPGIFTPFKMEESFLVDGGLVNPLPVNRAKELGKFVIAVDAVPKPEYGITRSAVRSRKLNVKHHKLPEKVNRYIKDVIKEIKSKKINLDPLNQIEGRINQFKKIPNIYTVILQTIDIVEHHIINMQLQSSKPDILIHPEAGYIGYLEFNRAKSAIQEGITAARKALRNY